MGIRFRRVFATVLFLTVVTAVGVAGDQQELQPRPTPMGVSMGNTPSAPFIYTGTGGMLVRSITEPNRIFILSNNHVLGVMGPTLCPNTAAIGTTTLQPGTLDIGSDPGADETYEVGWVSDIIPMDFSFFGRNLVDAAIAETVPSLAKSEILDIGEPDTTLDAGIVPVPGMSVTKGGRTTGVTAGTVAEVNITARINYGACGSARFVRQFSVTPGDFSDSGDSGSAILDSSNNRPVGLLFAGSSSRTIGNPILFVYLALGVVPEDAVPTRENLGRVRRIADNMFERFPRIRRLQEAQDRLEDAVLRVSGVHAIGIGRQTEGNARSDFGFVVYAERLTPRLEQMVRRLLRGYPVRFKQEPPFRAF